MMYADKLQQSLHTKFSKDHFLGKKDNAQRFLLWNTFYRRNIHRFVIDYFGLQLYWYQIIMIYMMNICSAICVVAARSAAKSYCVAIFSCAKAILYPGSKIVIASSTLKQSRLIVSEKIQVELMERSPNLRREIASIKDSPCDTIIRFRNGSTIRVVAANEGARGARATVILYEEARMIPKGIIDTVLSPFQIIRQTPYLAREPYCDIPELKEAPTDIYISSSWMASHWLIAEVAREFCKQMTEGKPAFVMALDYCITLKHGIKPMSFLKRAKETSDSMSFAIEYENLAPAQSQSAYFDFDLVNKNQTLRRAFYPRKDEDVLAHIKNKYDIPKIKGEIRVIACDIAMIQSDINDNSIYTCLRLLPESHVVGQAVQQDYRIQVPYLECMHGAETMAQATRIKQLYYDFNADYCVLDVRNAGVSIFDALAKVIYDDQRGVEYAPWTSMNNDTFAARVANQNATPVIYCVEGSAKLNSDIAINMRAMLSDRKIDLLINQSNMGEEISKIVPDYYVNSSPEYKLFFEQPYLETALLVDELINLQYEKMENTGLIKISEKSSARKDRYSSLSYGCYFASQLARDMLREPEEINLQNISLCVNAL